jgi:hypothetical protein
MFILKRLIHAATITFNPLPVNAGLAWTLQQTDKTRQNLKDRH